LDASTSSPEASHASPSRSPASKRAKRTPDGFGPSLPVLFGTFGHDGFSPRTSQDFSRLTTAERRKLSSGRFPTAGMTLSGQAYRLPPLVHRTCATESPLLPTPTASSYGSNAGGAGGRVGKVRLSLNAMASRNMWPTPTAWLGRRESQATGNAERYWNPERSNELSDAVAASGVAGELNPTWVEWLMGFPLGWTALEPSETP